MARAGGLVAGAGSSDHRLSARHHDNRHSLRLGSSKACGNSALADRKDDRARRKRTCSLLVVRKNNVRSCCLRQQTVIEALATAAQDGSRTGAQRTIVLAVLEGLRAAGAVSRGLEVPLMSLTGRSAHASAASRYFAPFAPAWRQAAPAWPQAAQAVAALP